MLCFFSKIKNFSKTKKDKNGKTIIIVSNFVRKGILKGKEISFKTLEISKFVQFRNMFNLLFEKKIDLSKFLINPTKENRLNIYFHDPLK